MELTNTKEELKCVLMACGVLLLMMVGVHQMLWLSAGCLATLTNVSALIITYLHYVVAPCCVNTCVCVCVGGSVCDYMCMYVSVFVFKSLVVSYLHIMINLILPVTLLYVSSAKTYSYCSP